MAAHKVGGKGLEPHAGKVMLLLSLLAVWDGMAAAVEGLRSKSLALHPGESQDISFPAGTDLSVSRRGVVDVFAVDASTWQLTALHAGTVVIDGRDALTGEVRSPRLIVNVLPAKIIEAGDLGRDQSGEDKPPALPIWICQVPGLRCESNLGMVRGTIEDIATFSLLRSACARVKGCVFAVRLTPAVLEQWRERLRRELGEGYNVSAAASGWPILEAYCGQNGRAQRQADIDGLTGRALSEGGAVFRCAEEAYAHANYRLVVRLYLLEDSAARELGFDGELRLNLVWPGRGSEADLLQKLRALTIARRAEVIAQPTVRMIANQEVSLGIGGEFQVIEHVLREGHDDSVPERASWKQTGLQLGLTAQPLGRDTVRMIYDMTYRSRPTSGSANLSVNTLKGALDLELGKMSMAGLLDLSEQDEGGKRYPWLTDIPIIGPLLFSWQARDHLHSRLLLWLDLRQAAVGTNNDEP